MSKAKDMDNENHAVEDILGALNDVVRDHNAVDLGTMRKAVGQRGYGPFLTLPAVIELTPIGAVPGVPTLLALIISAFALQIALGRKNMWLPDFVEGWSVDSSKMKKAIKKLHPFGQKVDRWFHGRLPLFTSDIAIRLGAIAAIVLCLTVPPLELVPFASSLPMSAIAIIGLAILMHDGVLMLVGYAAALVVVAVSFGVLGSF